jgi:PAS domain S-box-containing protein
MLTPTVVEISNWDRHELELAFRDSEKRLIEMVENAPIPIVLQDLQFRYVLANEHLRAMFWDGRDLVGKTPHDAWPPEVADRFVQHLREVLESGSPVESEDTVPGHDGPHTVLIQRSPLRDVSGEISAIAVMGMDITSQTRAEGEARAATAHAERATHAKSEVLARMSHGLRSPLNAIFGYCQLLQTEELSPAASDSVAGITNAARRLHELVEEVLEIAHLEAGTKALEVGPVHACDALREALQLVRPLAQERGIELAPDLRGGIYEFVAAEPSALRRGLTNILTNAIEHSPEVAGSPRRSRGAAKTFSGCSSPTPGQGSPRPIGSGSSYRSSAHARRAAKSRWASGSRSLRASSSQWAATSASSTRRRARAACSLSSSR